MPDEYYKQELQEPNKEENYRLKSTVCPEYYKQTKLINRLDFGPPDTLDYRKKTKKRNPTFGTTIRGSTSITCCCLYKQWETLGM
ncbi:hypothetical protein YC2023_043276 [Brassica napus]